MRRPHKVFDGWWIGSAGTALQIIIGGLMFQSFSSYAAILREEFGWSKTALSAAFSMSLWKAVCWVRRRAG